MDKLEEAKNHIEMAKNLVEESGMEWSKFLSDYSEMPSKEEMPMMKESSEDEMSEEEMPEEEGKGNPKKAQALILLLKKKRGEQ